jgi:hypothetical protein
MGQGLPGSRHDARGSRSSCPPRHDLRNQRRQLPPARMLTEPLGGRGSSAFSYRRTELVIHTCAHTQIGARATQNAGSPQSERDPHFSDGLLAGSKSGIAVIGGLADAGRTEAASTTLTTFPAAASRARYARCISTCDIRPPALGGRLRGRVVAGTEGGWTGFFAMPRFTITVI